MSFRLSSSVFGAAFQDPECAPLLGDEALFRAWLEVEAALARSQADLGMIPRAAAARVEAAARSLPFDATALASGVLRDGVPVIALIAELRAAAGPEAARYVHLGATSQDILDSGLVLCLGRALSHLSGRLDALLGELARLARAHRGTLVAARTHGQVALPSSFGLTVAGWAMPLVRQRERLAELRRRLLVLQLGGAAGTLAALGSRGLDVVRRVAHELGLGEPALPWHTQRDNLGELGGWLSLLAGSLGKLAQDVLLACQSEVGELSEAAPGQRGQSSSMPHKNNPMRSEQILAASRVIAGQLATLHHALVQEQQRGTHGWQVEWLTLGPMLELAGGALWNSLVLMRELEVHPERMRENVLASHGLVLAEAAVSALGALMPRPAAQSLVAEAAKEARERGRFLIDVVHERVEQLSPSELAGADLSSVDWAALSDPSRQLGSADALIERALAQIERA